jgi:YgiT-type zinc finger domain-containing protein
MKYEDCYCKNTKRKKVTTEIRLAGRTVLLENVMAWECQDCSALYFNGKYLMELERKLLAEAGDLKKHNEQDMKEEIDFTKGVRGKYVGQSFSVVGDDAVKGEDA